MIRKRPRGVYCSPDERAAIRERAAAAGKSVSRLVLDLAFAGDADPHASALTAEELVELLDGFRILVAFVRALKGQTTDGGDSGTVRGSGVSGDAGDADRSRRLPAERVRLPISATDKEWAAVHEQALRRGLSISRCLVGLVLPDGSLVLPGHGADTTVEASKAEFAVFKSKPQPADLHGNVLWTA